MLEDFDQKTEQACYIIMNLGMVLFAGIMLAVSVFHVDLHSLSPGCAFYRLTGYYCPGCGGTRAVAALLHFHILQSIRCHPLVVYTAGVLGVFWGSRTLRLAAGRPLPVMRLKPIYLYLALALVLIQWIVKNVLLYTGWTGIEMVF